MMPAFRRISAFLSLFIVFISACKAGTPPPTPATLLNAAQGGQISFGTVPGAATQAQAMSRMLTNIQKTCGEKPQIGKVFQFKGTKTVGVFFTVTDHTKGNKKLAGLVLSAHSGPRQVDAAQLSNDAQRFGKTVNPMLQQLFSVWHPDGQAAASSSASGGRPASGGGAATSGPAQLHTVTLPDNSASVGVPDGWHVDPKSGGGTPVVRGPHGESVGLGLAQSGLDMNDPQLRSLAQYGNRPSTKGRIALPFNVDLTRAYPEVLRQWRHNNGINAPVNWQNIRAERMSTQRGVQCVHITGNIVDDGKQGTDETSMILCFQKYVQGNYTVMIYQSLIPVELADRERATAGAIMASYQMNQAVVAQQANAIAAPTIAAIHAIGDQATARYNATQKANDAQHASYWAQQNSNDAQHAAWNADQDNKARNGQGFSNYILDQTVVQGNDIDGSGAVGHATVSNSTADALVKADPNRFEIVDAPNYWEGTDYHQ